MINACKWLPVCQDFPPRFQIDDAPNIIFQGYGLVLLLAVPVDQADLLPMVQKVHQELLLCDNPHVDPVLKQSDKSGC